MKVFKIFTILLIAVVMCAGLFPLQKISAATAYDNYIWTYLYPQNINSASNSLVLKLKTEVEKIIAAGHLAPFRTLYGETTVHYSWYHRYDSVYTLSLAYPYLSAYSSLQNSIKTYISSELTTYPLTSAAYLDANTGTLREPDLITTAQRYSMNASYSNRPKLFALYVLWLYANNTNSWSYIDSNWAAIQSFYTSYKSEIASYYSSIAGGVGMARLAHYKANSSLENSVTADLVTGFDNGKNFAQFGANAEAAYKWEDNGWASWTKTNVYTGFQFLDITPEIGRYMSDFPTLKTAVIGDGTDNYSISKGKKMYKLWYMAQAPFFTRAYGEGSAVLPELKAMIFPIQTWVVKDPSYIVSTYTDVGDALLGDLYYIQNLTRAIEQYGNTCWKSVLDNSVSCTQVLGDFNSDSNITIQDLSILLTKLDLSDKTNLYKYRMRQTKTTNGDSINVQDLSILLTKL